MDSPVRDDADGRRGGGASLVLDKLEVVPPLAGRVASALDDPVFDREDPPRFLGGMSTFFAVMSIRFAAAFVFVGLPML